MDLKARKIKAPLSVQFELTYECNNYCLFCYNVWKNPKLKKNKKPEGNLAKKDYLSYEEICKILDNLNNDGVFHLTLTGGEPTLHPDFLRILEYGYKIGLNPSFVTNGNLINSMLARDIKATGVGHCQVSMHGPNKEVHEELTQVKGSFNKVTNAIKNLVSEGINVNVNMTVNKINKNYIWDTAALAKKLGTNYFSITRFVAVGSGLYNESLIGLEIEDLDYLVDEIARVEEELGMNIKVLTPIPLCSINNPEKVAGRMSGCDGGITWCAISPKGEVRHCTNFDIVVGDLKESSLSKIWEESEILNNCRTLKYVPEVCKECKAFFFCGGGCRACSYNASNGNFKAADPSSNFSNLDTIESKCEKIMAKFTNEQNEMIEKTDKLLEKPHDTVCPLINGHLRAREEEFGLLASTGQNHIILNEDGLKILKLCNGERSLQEIIDIFREKYKNKDKNLEEKMLSFLKDSTIKKVIIWKDKEILNHYEKEVG